MISLFLTKLAILIPVAISITFFDLRDRRIPNKAVLVTLCCGIIANTVLNGRLGLLMSLSGCLFAFGLMLLMHLFGAMGPGDVKLFGAIGAVIGPGLVLKSFLIVLITGGLIACLSMFRWGTARETVRRVLWIFYSVILGWKIPRFAVPEDRRKTIPYGLAIVYGTLISLFIFRN